MISDLFEVVGRFLLFLLVFFIKSVILFSDIFYELDDGLIMVVVNRIFYLLVMEVGVEMLEEELKQLRDAVFDDSAL